MTPTIEWKKTHPGSTEAVQFTDGMLVTAEDLNQAMGYPLSVIQVLLKAYFGCGIVCGLDVKHPDEEQPPAPDAAKETADTVRATDPDCDRNYVLTVERGVALGCDGYPIEICGPLRLDLTPDPCRKDHSDKEMFVAARRVTAREAAARPCGCGPAAGDPAQQCTRMRDHALVQAFDYDGLPPNLQKAVHALMEDNKEAEKRAPLTPGQADCEGLKQCADCACCGEPWVLLGSLVVGTGGLGPVDRSLRRYVKPIACLCPASRNGQKPPPSAEATTAAGASDKAPDVAAAADKQPEAPVPAPAPPAG